MPWKAGGTDISVVVYGGTMGFASDMRIVDFFHRFLFLGAFLFFCVAGEEAGASSLRSVSPLIIIKANGMSESAEAFSSGGVTLELDLDIRDSTETAADWWLVQMLPSGSVRWYNPLSGMFEPDLFPTHQGKPMNLSSVPLEIPGALEVGEHRFYFGIDFVQDGKVDVSTLYFDIVTVTVTEQPSARRKERLLAAETWMYQIQGLDEDGAVQVLAETDYPLLVLEPGHNFLDFSYETKEMLTALRETPDGEQRLLIAYIDVGQAEDYRDYWQEDWVAPEGTNPGKPDFLVTVDPDGWSGNYPVAYWDSRWKELWLGESGIVGELARMGFDGIYLDWVEAYDDDHVRLAAEEAGVEPELEMIKFIEELGLAGSKIMPDFLVIPQNAPYLIDTDGDRYTAAVDALAVEDTWFHGNGDAEWDDPGAGDLQERHDDEWSTEVRLAKYKEYQDRGLPVFSVDYCIDTDNAALVYREAREAGLRPLVTRVSLSQLTVTPPPLEGMGQ